MRIKSPLEPFPALREGDLIARTTLERSNRHTLAIDPHMAVKNHLSSVSTAVSESHAINDIVEASLEDLEHIHARHPGHPESLVEAITELLGHQAVGPAKFLSLAELSSIIRSPSTEDLGMHARPVVPLLDRAFGSKAAISLEEELAALGATLSADRARVACHESTP
jgi:hypothetical protein